MPGKAPRKWLWFAGLWLAGVGAVTLLAYGLRAILLP